MRKFRKKKPSGRRKISADKIFLPDWEAETPINVDRRYGTFYTQLANQVLQVINSKREMLKARKLGRDDCKVLALMLTRYFEDYISEIGIWEVFIKKNQQLYGWSVPFYQTEEEREEDVIYPADICFLVWYFLSKTADEFINPEVTTIMEIGLEVCLIFDEAIDDAPATEGYEAFFDIPDDIPFFELKRRLNWMSLHSYLLGFEFNLELLKSLEEMRETNPEMFTPEHIGHLTYGMQDDYNFRRCSSLSAISNLEWFSEIATCSEEMKAAILELDKRVMSQFIFEGEDEMYYHFKEMRTNNPFLIHRDSVDLTSGTKVGDMCAFSILNWKGDWWLSGSFMSWGKAKAGDEKKMQQDIQQIPFYAYSKADQDQIWHIVKEGHQDFIDFFGDIITVFKNNDEMKLKLLDFYVFQRKKTMERMGKTASPEDLRETRDHMRSMLNGIGLGIGKPVAAVSVEKAGMAFSEGVPDIIEKLQQPTLTLQERGMLYYDTFMAEVHPSIGAYILEKYPSQNLKLPFSVTKIDVDKHAKFLFRYFSPNEYGTQPPNMRLTPESSSH